MNKEPLITVIIPVYNVESYIKKCVKSIINQTYHNLEIIIVDDGSTDNSGKICDELALLDNRIKIIHKENGGLSDARNTGIDIANGEYIGFVDSDDYIDEEMYEQLLEACRESCAEISICGRICEVIATQKNYDLFTTDKKVLSSEAAIRNLLLQIDCDSAAWDKLYDAKLFKTVRYPFGVLHEDLNVTTRLFSLATRVAYIGKPLYHYQIRKDSICNQAFSEKKMDIYLQASACREFVKRKYPLCDEANAFVIRNVIVMVDSALNSKRIEKSIKKKLRKTIIYEFNESRKNPYVAVKTRVRLLKKYLQLFLK